MPDFDGYQLIQKIRALEYSCNRADGTRGPTTASGRCSPATRCISRSPSPRELVAGIASLLTVHTWNSSSD
jgi:hypothetical protein